MKVLFLTKTFRDGEGVSEYVKSIAERLTEEGHESCIVSFDDESYYSVNKQVDVERFSLPFEGDNIFNWSIMMNNELKARARELFQERDFDLIHVNDWTTITSGITLSKQFEKPLILTLHSTENERGFKGEHAEMISELEWQGVYESNKVLTTKEDTKNSVLFDLGAPDQKVEVIDPYNEDWTSRVIETYREMRKKKKEVTE